MINGIEYIYYDKEFIEQFKHLSDVIRQKALVKEKIFRTNPFHGSLRIHKLRGKLKDLWSISIEMKYRIIFQIMGEGKVVFLSIGTHALYKTSL